MPRVEREPTGDLTEDIVGSWYQSEQEAPTNHPMTTLAYESGGDRVWAFDQDGTGRMWYLGLQAAEDHFGEVDLSWRVEDGHLVINDLPPATVEMQVDAMLVRTLEPVDSQEDAVVMVRCELTPSE